jgi:hypothetical protein
MAAAQRQLDAAIRMVFYNEDDVAIYTVAAAAHRVLRDIMGKRGRSAGAETIKDSIRGMANALVQGTLPNHDRELFEREEFWPAVLALAEQIRCGGGDMLLTGGHPSLDKTFWNWQNEVANFLKHADRDSNHTISERKINLNHVLLSACMTYGQLMGKLTIEMQVYGAFASLENDHGPKLPEQIRAMRIGLLRFAPARRQKACLQLISELKRVERQRRPTAPHWS